MKLKYKKKSGGWWAKFFKAFKWIKPEDSENLTKNQKHEQLANILKWNFTWSLKTVCRYAYFKLINLSFQEQII